MSVLAASRPLGLVLLCGAVVAMACEPMGPIPGGELKGTLVAEPVADWTFTADHDTIEIETRPDDPHSVTVWCVAIGDRLYVPTRDPDKKRWVQFAAADPSVRIRVDDQLFPGVAQRVTDAAELEAVVPLLVEKYDLDPPEEGDDIWIFRVESPQG